jgi:N-acetylmuramoyl-L-alanine amidase
MPTIAISSGHGLHIRGASGILDEVDEARKVVNEVSRLLKDMGVTVYTFHDDVSTTQSENLNRIVTWHNSQTRTIDASCHFNAYQNTSKPMGTECLYVTQEDLAAKVSSAIANAASFINRGAKYRSDLAFLNGTNKPAILIETCFVDSSADAELYRQFFPDICDAIAETLSGKTLDGGDTEEPPPVYPIWRTSGKTSWFGGPDDEGVAPDEGLAFIYEYEDAPHLFLPYQPDGTTGLARRLDPAVNYLAMRFDYDVYPKDMLASSKWMAKVRAPSTGKEFLAYPADWGPNEATGRTSDLSPGLLDTLGIKTDDVVEIEFPVAADVILPPDEVEGVIPPVIEMHISSDQPVTLRITAPGSNITLDIPDGAE